MWFFIVLTFGSSYIPTYIATQGPFASQEQCGAAREIAMNLVQEEKRQIKATECWRNGRG